MIIGIIRIKMKKMMIMIIRIVRIIRIIMIKMIIRKMHSEKSSVIIYRIFLNGKNDNIFLAILRWLEVAVVNKACIFLDK